jgi:hypothetical protein
MLFLGLALWAPVFPAFSQSPEPPAASAVPEPSAPAPIQGQEAAPKPVTPLAAGFANLVLGLGSYMNGDITGGLIITAGYAASLGLILYDVLALSYKDNLAGVLAPSA